MNNNEREEHEWSESVKRDLIPKMQDSEFVISLVPETTDIKFAVELGLSIMLDKPIIAIKQPEVPIPAKLALVADRVVEIDMHAPGAHELIARVLSEVTDEIKPKEGEG